MKNYIWQITNLYVKDIDGKIDYVVNTLFDVLGTDEVDGTEYSYTLKMNNMSFEVSEGSDYIPFEDLTNEIVIGWVKELLGPEGVTSYEAAVAGKIDSQINPPVAPVSKDLPWV